MAKKKLTVEEFTPCLLKQLPEDMEINAALAAVDENPANAPPPQAVSLLSDVAVTPARLAVLTSRYWGVNGVKLGVYFMDGAAQDLQDRVLSHFNAWGKTANVKFLKASSGMAQVRIARQRGGGYWSYLGTDVLQIPVSQPTMNLDSFTMSTPESEYLRVVRHECGHTLGFPHEHLRASIIARLDRARTVAYFRQNYGWDERTTVSNVLTPVEEHALIATPQADETSIMAYQLPASITRDGRPITGGGDINDTDAAFVAKLYPRETVPPPPDGKWKIIVEGVGARPIIVTE